MQQKLNTSRKRFFSAIQTNLMFSIAILLCAVLLNAGFAYGQKSFGHSSRIKTQTESPAAPVTITQSSSMTVVPGNSVACYDSTSNTTVENSYWRAFVPSNSTPPIAPNEQLTLTSLTIGVEQADAPAGSQPLVIRIYTNSAANFPAGTRTLVSTTNYTLNNLAIEGLITIPLSTTVIPAGTPQFVVEVFNDNSATLGATFFIGSNTAAETGPSYISSPGPEDCDINTPTDLAAIGFPNMNIVMSLSGNTAVPSAAGVTVSGKVLTSSGRPVSRATVTATRANGEIKTAITDKRGNYILEELTAGETYVFEVRYKGSQFPARAVTLSEDLTDFDFTASQ